MSSLETVRNMLRQEKDYLSEIMNFATNKSRNLPRPTNTRSSFSIEDILLKSTSSASNRATLGSHHITATASSPAVPPPSRSTASENVESVLASYLPLTLPGHYPAAAAAAAAAAATLPPYACEYSVTIPLTIYIKYISYIS